MSSGAQHYVEAEKWLRSAGRADIRPDEEQRFLAFALVHATLAHTAATALCIPSEGAVSTDEVTGWNRVLG